MAVGTMISFFIPDTHATKEELKMPKKGEKGGEAGGSDKTRCFRNSKTNI